MTPEQSGLLIAAVVGLIIAVIGAFVELFRRLPTIVKQVNEENLKEREHKRNMEKLETDTELETKRVESEIKLREALAQAEVLEKFMEVFSQQQERHTKVDERNADTAERRNEIDERRIEVDKQKIESDNRLASAIDTLTRSSNTSQLWQESRANDFIDTANLINERVGGLERVGKSVIDSMTKIEIDLGEVRNKLNRIIEAHPTFAQQNTLLAIESGLASVKLMLESLVPKAPIVPVEREKAPSLEDTIPLSPDDMLEATRVFPDAETEAPKPETNEEKKDAA